MLISIIVPVYKVEKYIYRCIKSILMQSLDNFELILVDDGSYDKCGDICDSFASLDERIHVIHKPNGGLSDARNIGIDWAYINSDSDWLTFIDSDDWVHPKYLEALYNAVIETKAQIGICGYKKVLCDEVVIDKADINAEIVNTEDFFCENNVNAVVAWGKLYKKEFFKKIRFPFKKLHEDEFTTYKILFKFDKIVYTDFPLYYYFQSNDSIIRSEWNPRKIALLEAIDESCDFFLSNKFFRAYRFSLHRLALSSFIFYRNIVMKNYVSGMEKYLSQIIHYLRKTLFIGRRISLFPIKEYYYLYEIAFPNLMKLYWYGKAAKKRIKGD